MRDVSAYDSHVETFAVDEHFSRVQRGLVLRFFRLMDPLSQNKFHLSLSILVDTRIRPAPARCDCEKSSDNQDENGFYETGSLLSRIKHLFHCVFAPPTKTALGNIMRTPLLPSTSCVMWRSAATLASI